MTSYYQGGRCQFTTAARGSLSRFMISSGSSSAAHIITVRYLIYLRHDHSLSHDSRYPRRRHSQQRHPLHGRHGLKDSGGGLQQSEGEPGRDDDAEVASLRDHAPCKSPIKLFFRFNLYNVNTWQTKQIQLSHYFIILSI